MKIRIEIEDNLKEAEIIIRSSVLDEEVQKIQRAVADIVSMEQRLVFYKGDTSYYLPLEDVLFFETEESEVHAHTRKEIYRTKYRLYELEEMLPGYGRARRYRSVQPSAHCIFCGLPHKKRSP